ncbi:nuclear receptor coactivator 1-like [Watersipora subatra]|uniref:nuclear receptor coactivator 1-like n=1 Tax=Watersipora subatra TaxID=2589382 RepID=UPI00355C30F7
MPVSREILFLQDAAEKIASLNASVSSAPVEEGEVSSSNPPILATEQFEPALQELQGFLFILNFQGKIVSVTDNVTNYLGYQPSEWPDASIYDFLHVTNHASFSQNMLSRLGDGKACLNSTTIIPPFPCRMRPGTSPTVMSPTDGMGKKTDSESLIHVQISSLPFCIERLSSQSSSSASGSSLYLVCIAQKVDDPIAMWSRPVARSSRRFTPQPQSSFLPISSTKSSAQVDFAMQLNLDWLILHCDFRGMSEPNDLSSRFIGKKFTNFVHNNDLTPFQKYADTGLIANSQRSVVELST